MRGFRRLLFLALTALLVLAGCRKEEGRYPFLYFWLILDQGKPEQTAFLDLVESRDDPLGPGIQGAQVQVIGPHGSTSFHEGADSNFVLYKDTTALRWLQPGTPYELLVVTPSGDTLRSHTWVPGDFQILYPQDGDTLQVPSTDSLVWTPSDSLIWYVIYIVPEDTTLNWSLVFSGDTLAPIFHWTHYFPDSGWYTIDVRAENRDAYLWNNEGVSNIEGGVGVFGATTSRAVRVYIRR